MAKRILVIDDEEDLLTTLKYRLESEGYEVATLSDPVETENYIEKFHPELLIIDVFMPERSGFNILEDFEEKGVYKDLPKIFLTSLDDNVEKMVAKECGVSRYITKPFDQVELLNNVKAVLDKK